jgi:hypothetical protein
MIPLEQFKFEQPDDSLINQPLISMQYIAHMSRNGVDYANILMAKIHYD